ncbi:response regulator transcription factor [Teredinibacter purpureus]|uniref:response regulator transcription factor n=1 Tax=Teredinibacter purpureus TaxID=2731756 RepID=UPI0005F81D7E|nr:response regulator transcription factor [Teredinibacter purpureus]
MLKVFIVEDQALVRGALCALLQLEGDIEIVGQAENGQQALERIKTLDFDIVLTDIEMPKITGIELIEQVRERYPHIKTAIVTTFGRAGYIKRALSAGVDAFLLKDAPSEDLAQALRRIMQGRKVIDPELAIAALDIQDPLTEKERKALQLAGEGKSTADIAVALFLSEGTVRNYLSEAISKLNATNRIDAARLAKQKGWL